MEIINTFVAGLATILVFLGVSGGLFILSFVGYMILTIIYEPATLWKNKPLIIASGMGVISIVLLIFFVICYLVGLLIT